jgi:hypothetical protein
MSTGALVHCEQTVMLTRPVSVYRLCQMPIRSCAQSVSAPAREIGRQVECPYSVAGKASALGAGSDISAYWKVDE